jgi:branched-chain amino acid transport system ATP-binding protein
MTLLRVEALSKSFGGVRAVDALSFELAAGELLALVGPNGAGKSTTFNLINGQLEPDQGSIRLADRELAGLPPHRIWREGVSRTFQVAAAFASFSVVENVQLALLSTDRRLWRPWAPARAHRRDDALALLAAVGLREQADRPCHVLAYADLKRVELALALASRPRLLLMDEPTAGMAAPERDQIVALVKRLAREQQLGVLFTEHNLEVVFRYADRVLVLARGRKLADGKPDDVRDDPAVQQAYFGKVTR